MASQSQETPLRRRPPPPRPKSPPPTTIRDLGDDLVLEIFLRLPSLPSLVRAAFACRAFLAAVRSSPAFRRRFRALHGPPVLGVFLGRDVTDVRSYAPLRRRSDPGFSAAARGSDFFLNRVPDFLACAGWHVVACRGGFVLLLNYYHIAAYNPLTGALDLFPAPPRGGGEIIYHYHMVPYDCNEAAGSFRVASLIRDGSQLRAAVFSSDTREWQILPWTGVAPAQQLVGIHQHDHLRTGPQVEGRVYWTHEERAYCIVLDTTTLQFSTIDLPAHLKGQGHTYRTGQTKDGRLCIVHAVEFTISIWLRTADAGGADQWMLDSVIPLEEEVFKATKGSRAEYSSLKVWAILDGTVYLSTSDRSSDAIKACWFLSFCLETRKLEKLFCKTAYHDFYPYIMAWPPSLVGNN